MGLFIIINPSVSIHAPAWGATFRALLVQCAAAFQSTLPRGERLV